MAYFFSYCHHAIGSKWRPLEVLAQSKFIRVCQIQSMSNSEYLNFFRLYLLGPNSESFTVCFFGFLIP